MTVSTAEPLGLDVRSLVAGVCFVAAVAAPGQSLAQTTGSIPAGQCASLGEGFVPVAGSNSCVRIGGHVRVDASAASDAARSGVRPVGHSYVRAPTGWTGLYPR